MCMSQKRWFTTASLHRLAIETIRKRQRANGAFTFLLMNLTLLIQDDVHSLFSCTKCERRMPDGTKRLDGIVMDRTAMGILGKLPNYERVKNKLFPSRNMAVRQYLMQTTSVCWC